MPVIGFLSPGSLEADTSRMNAVRRGLAEIGYVEGQNVAIEYRGAQHQYDRLPALAVDLVSRQVAVIVVVSHPRNACCQGGDQHDSDRVLHGR